MKFKQYIVGVWLLVAFCYPLSMRAQSIRKNYLEMTPQEQADYRAALQVMYLPYIREIAEHHGEHFCTDIHRASTGNGQYFLPWHRFALLDFEEHLKQTPTGSYLSIPYWDWGTDNDKTNPNFWGSTTNPNSFLAFSNFSSWNAINNFICTSNLNTSQPVAPLTRNLSNATVAATTNTVNTALTNAFANATYYNLNGSISTFSTITEVNLHNFMHNWVAGTMVQGTAPLEPSFWLHHARVDKVWFDKEEQTSGNFSLFNSPNTVMPHYDGIHDPGLNIVTPNGVTNSRSEQRPKISGTGRNQDVWYAENKTVILDGANGAPFIANDVTKPYLYRYTAAITPGNTAVRGTLFAGDIRRDASGNVILDNKGGFTVGAGVTCNFRAGGAIVLLPGFKTTTGTKKFEAKIITVPNGFMLASPSSKTPLNAKPGDAEGRDIAINVEQTTNKSLVANFYPNPADQQLMVNYKTPQDVQIQVVNMLGRVVKTTTLPKNQVQLAIETSDLVNGMYLIRLYDSTGKTVKTEKFTVRHD